MNDLWRPTSIPLGWSAAYKSLSAQWDLVCPHGKSHPHPDDPNLKGDGIHACDGCCSEFKEFSINPINLINKDNENDIQRRVAMHSQHLGDATKS